MRYLGYNGSKYKLTYSGETTLENYVTVDGETLYLDDSINYTILYNYYSGGLGYNVTEYLLIMLDDPWGITDAEDYTKSSSGYTYTEADEEDSDTFNAQFESYMYDTLTYSQLQELLQKIITSNTYYSDHIITVNGSQPTTTTPTDGDEYDLYDVNWSMDDDFYYCSMTYSVIDDSESSSAYMEGVSFKLYYKSSENSTGYWVNGTGNDQKGYGSYSDATTYTTDSAGSVSITGLKKGIYYIYETDIDETVTAGYYLEDQYGYISDSSSEGYINSNTVGMVYCGYIIISDDTYTTYMTTSSNIKKGKVTGYTENADITRSNTKTSFTFSAYNVKSGNLTLNKTDYDTGDTVTSEVRFKLYYVDEGTWVSGSRKANKTYVSSSSEATTYTTSDGDITIKFLRLGTYYIYECGNDATGYYLEDQRTPNMTGNRRDVLLYRRFRHTRLRG